MVVYPIRIHQLLPVGSGPAGHKEIGRGVAEHTATNTGRAAGPGNLLTRSYTLIAACSAESRGEALERPAAGWSKLLTVPETAFV